jgi:hypothetical protein
MSKNFGFPHNNMQGIGSSTEGYLTGSQIFENYGHISGSALRNLGTMVICQSHLSMF